MDLRCQEADLKIENLIIWLKSGHEKSARMLVKRLISVIQLIQINTDWL